LEVEDPLLEVEDPLVGGRSRLLDEGEGAVNPRKKLLDILKQGNLRNSSNFRNCYWIS
jgi:hypothetical protein